MPHQTPSGSTTQTRAPMSIRRSTPPLAAKVLPAPDVPTKASRSSRILSGSACFMGYPPAFRSALRGGVVRRDFTLERLADLLVLGLALAGQPRDRVDVALLEFGQGRQVRRLDHLLDQA